MDHQTHEHNGSARNLKYALVILGVVLVILAILLVLEYRALRREEIITARESWLTSFLHRHGPLTANDADLIRSWMTFDYVNAIFKLPPDYLQSNLQIKDPRYPRVSISEYTGDAHIDSASFLKAVDGAVQAYLTTK